MAKLPEKPTGGAVAPPSAGRGRNFYVVEILLGAGLLLLVVLVIWHGSPREEPAETHRNVVTLTAANWDHEVAASQVPVLVDFWAPWCGPCRMLSPAIERIAERYAGRVKVAKLNIDDAKSLAARYNIRYIPQVYLFHGTAQPRALWVNPGDLKASEDALAEELDGILQ